MVNGKVKIKNPTGLHLKAGGAVLQDGDAV